MNTHTKLISAEEWKKSLWFVTKQELIKNDCVDIITQIQLNALEWAAEQAEEVAGDFYTYQVTYDALQAAKRRILSQIAELKKGQQ